MSYPRVLCGLLIVSVGVVIGLSRFIGWNSSPSAAAVGFYWREKPHLQRGQLVEVCLPPQIAELGIERRYISHSWLCPDGSQPLIKMVLGMPGDEIDITPSMVLNKDRGGRSMEHVTFGQHQVGAGQIWLYGSARNSWDSRYYSAVPMANVIANLTPLWTWGSK
jgi:conjugative transfer signal peptidase TraF